MTTTAKKTTAKKRATVPAAEKTTAKTATAVDALTDIPAGVHEVSIDLIDPHPHNPRKDLGDLTELTDSIKAEGVRQNLTLVPNPDQPGRYRTVIGHRRAAAAALAGLPTVPAAIDPHLDDARQRALMLTENLQRADLTAFEEGDGYQGLIDLGWSAEDIARETGRGISTVRGRVKISHLDDTARKGFEPGTQLTIQQAMELAEVQEKDRRAYEAAVKRFDNGVFAPWVIDEAKRAMEHTEKLKKLLAKAKADGVTLVKDKPPYSTVTVKDLGLTFKTHADCPGASTWVGDEYDWSGHPKASRIDFCTDPATHHPDALKASGKAAPGTDDEAERQRRREEAAAQGAALGEARTARRTWMTQIFTSTDTAAKKPRDAMTAFAATIVYQAELVADADLRVWADLDDRRQFGGDPVTPPRPSDTTALLALAVLAGVEDEVPTYSNAIESMGEKWAKTSTYWVGKYLAELDGAGYPLADIEQQLLERAMDVTDAKAGDGS